MCHECKGKGWRWVGVMDNAIREECDLCTGTGRNGSLLLLGICTLAAWAAVLGLIWWVTQIA